MKCANHLESEALTVCNHCGKSICRECLVMLNGENYCKECALSKPKTPNASSRSPASANGQAGQITQGKITVKKNSGCLVAFLIGIAVMFFGAIIIAISAAIVIPGFVMAKTRANQASAEAMVKNLSSAIEFYHAESKGKYPLAEETLIQYLPDAYKEGKVNGYVIIKELREDGYRIIARPIQCNNTGKKVFIMETGRNFIVRDCQEGGNYD